MINFKKNFTLYIKFQILSKIFLEIVFRVKFELFKQKFQLNLNYILLKILQHQSDNF